MNRVKVAVLYIAIALMFSAAYLLVVMLAYKTGVTTGGKPDDADTQIQALKSRVTDLTTRVERLEKNQELCAWMERGVRK